MSPSVPKQLHLFEAFGVELEYMIVDAGSFDVRPIADRLMHAATGAFEGETDRANGISWSNELVNHVVELKTTDPVPSLVQNAGATAKAFASSVVELDGLLGPLGARLMPSAMHPWMVPARETVLWAHEFSDVYQTFDRLFNCRRHGWANLQSVHLNLPFSGDEEFGRLHAAVRLILPLLPALCASSPIMEGRSTGILCNRMDVYRSNQAAVPSLAGLVIPEPVYTHEEYQRVIMDPIARDVARLDPSGLMRPEWMNSRGAIARFDRGSVEIRVMDVQECPGADVAIASAVVSVLKWLVSEAPSAWSDQKQMSTVRLRTVLDQTILHGERAVIADSGYLTLLGMEQTGAAAAAVWAHLLEAAGVAYRDDPAFSPLRMILNDGPLARRMLKIVGNPRGPIEREPLTNLARRLCHSLRSGTMLSDSD